MSMIPAQSGQIAPQHDTFDVIGPAADLAGRLAKTEFVPAGLRNRPEAVLAAILSGREVGLPPMQSLAMIDVIDGRPSLRAQAARALIQSKGHDVWLEESTITRCVLCARRRGEDHVHKVTWTADDAQRAGLNGKPNWRRYPRNMLVARATGELARLAFADVLGGLAWMAEELEDDVQPGQGEPDGAAPEQPKPEGHQRSTRGRTRRAPRNVTPPESPAAPPEPDIAPPGAEPEPSRADAGRDEPDTPRTSTSAGSGDADGHGSDSQGDEPERPAPPVTAGDVPAAPGSSLTLAQQIAMTCREAGVERADLIRAVTGKTSAREVTREEALEILSQARRIAHDEAQLVELDGAHTVVDVVDGACDDAEEEQQGD